MYITNQIGRQIVILRAEAGWTQQQLAEKLNTSQRTIAAWESGEAVPRKTMQVNIAKTFELPEDFFFRMSLCREKKKEETETRKKLLYAIDNALEETGLDLSEEKKLIFADSIQEVFTIKK